MKRILLSVPHMGGSEQMYVHIRTVLAGVLACAPMDSAKAFLRRCHWNQNLGGRGMIKSGV